MVDESLQTFFMSEIPDLSQTKYRGDARAHVDAVLKSAAPAKKEVKQHKNIKVQHRTLQRSIDVFKEFMNE